MCSVNNNIKTNTLAHFAIILRGPRTLGTRPRTRDKTIIIIIVITINTTGIEVEVPFRRNKKLWPKNRRVFPRSFALTKSRLFRLFPSVSSFCFHATDANFSVFPVRFCRANAIYYTTRWSTDPMWPVDFTRDGRQTITRLGRGPVRSQTAIGVCRTRPFSQRVC